MNRALAAALTVTIAAAAVTTPMTAAHADAVRSKQWHLKFLDIAEAHRSATGRGVTVAVIDSGVSRHPDLAGSIVAGADFIQKGRNGQTDNTGHGTGMAGLIAAHGASGSGALGIAPDARILPIRVFNNKPRNAELAQAISYAISHGATVINLSVGGGLDPRTITAVQEAADDDVVIIASAGNKPQDAGVVAPAFMEPIVAVGAVDRSGRRADVSVTGPALDLMAPGEDIQTTSNNGQYRSGTGTSDAAAIVSGAAALLRSKYPDMTAEEVIQRLEQTATDKGAPGIDPEYGHGIVNIVAALSDDTTPTSGGQSATPTTVPPTSATTPAASTEAAPDTDAAGSSTPLIAGGIAVVLLAGLGTAFALRRRKSHSTG